MPQLPVILSAFANSPEQAYLTQLEAEQDLLLKVFRYRSDLRHINLFKTKQEQFLEALQAYPDTLQVLHFGGHANGSQLYLEDQAGQGQGLAQILETYPNIQLVFLNGCNTLNQAEAFLKMGVPAVIVTTCSVEDGHATSFVKTFYTALANHQNLEAAFKQAVGAATFRGQESDGDTIVHYRGLELEDAKESPSWRLYVQEDQAVAIKGWTFSNPARLPYLINYYQGLKTKMPKGVRFLDQYFIEGTEAIKYKHYLSEGVLPYYSLDAFHLEKGYPAGKFSEAHLLQELLGGDHIEGGIISGKGGVGKTRMMLQMGLMAHEAGWNVAVLNERFEDEAELGAFLDGLERKKHLLLIDYIEECSWFNDSFLDEVKAHCSGVEDLRFLANCRNSFHYPHSSRCLDIQLDTHPQQAEYQQWIVELILQDFNSQLREQARMQFFVKKPSFAVFLRYLQQRYSERDLLEVGDFKDWLIHRFCRTVDPTRKSINEFGEEIKWLLCFPLTRAEKEEYLKVGSKFRLTLDTLIKDGWVEESNLEGLDTLLIIEDTVMDLLAVAYFQRFSDLKTELLFSFEWALKLEKGKNWMRSMHRIRDTLLQQDSKHTFFEFF